MISLISKTIHIAQPPHLSAQPFEGAEDPYKCFLAFLGIFCSSTIKNISVTTQQFWGSNRVLSRPVSIIKSIGDLGYKSLFWLTFLFWPGGKPPLILVWHNQEIYERKKKLLLYTPLIFFEFTFLLFPSFSGGRGGGGFHTEGSVRST